MHARLRLSLLASLMLALGSAACGDDPPPAVTPDASQELPDGSTDPGDAGLRPDAGLDPDGGEIAGDLELLSVTPAFGTTIARNAVFTLSFSQPLAQSSVTAETLFLHPTADGAAARVAAGLAFGADGSSVTLTPDAALSPGTGYTLVARGGAAGVTGLDGELLGADATGTFTTTDSSDTTPPTVASTDPADGAEDVPLDSVIRIRFSEPIDAASLTADSFQLIEWWDGNPQGAPLSGTWDTSGNPEIVFTPDAWFEIGDEFRFTVFAGVRDLAGNPMAADHAIVFDAAWVSPDNTPKVLTTSPADAETGVFTSTAITVTFSKRMRQSTVSAPATVKVYAGGNAAAAITMTKQTFGNPTFVFYPQATLQPNTTYNLVVVGGAGGVEDEANNPMTADFRATFTTGAGADPSPLEVVSVTPADAATGVHQTARVEVTFNKPVDPAKLFLSYTGTTGTFRVSRYADGSFPEAGLLDFAANPTVAFDIDPSTTYELERAYHVKITGGPQGARALSGATMAADFASSFTVKSPDNPDATIADLRAADGVCALRVRGVYMTYYRDQPNNWKGFFVQKDQAGPAIFVVTGNRGPLFPIYPAAGASGYPNIDLTVTLVGDFHGFKQVLAWSMTRNTADTPDLPWVKDNLVQVVGDEPLGVEHESEYVQLDGTLANYRPGGSAENREYDLLYGTNRRVTLKISQFGITEPLGLGNGSVVRVLAPLQKDDDGFFLKPYYYTSETPMTPAQLDDPANYDNLLDVVELDLTPP